MIKPIIFHKCFIKQFIFGFRFFSYAGVEAREALQNARHFVMKRKAERRNTGLSVNAVLQKLTIFFKNVILEKWKI